MRALVTGGAGFIGSSIASSLASGGHEVRVLDDLSTGFRENVPEGMHFIAGDVADADVIREAIRDVEIVFHQAAARAVQRSVDEPLVTDHVNTHGTLIVLQAAREAGVRRVVYASSSSIYGGAAELPTPETSALMPRSPYAVTKLAGEHYCRVFSELFGLETVALRYFNVYGPRQRPDSMYAAVIPLFIDALRKQQAPVVHGDGMQSRDFTYIDDVVAANLAAAEAPAAACSGKAYNVAGGSQHSLLQLLEILQAHLGTAVAPEFTAPRAGDVRHTRADPSAAARDLGWSAQVGFEEGLARTVDWFSQP